MIISRREKIIESTLSEKFAAASRLEILFGVFAANRTMGNIINRA